MDYALGNDTFVQFDNENEEKTGLSKISFLAKDIEQQTFFAISKDRKDFIDINEDGDLNHAVLGVKPSGGMWASIPSNHLGMVSKWHEWCLDEGFRLEKLNYVTEFELKSDAKVLYIKSVEDLEILAKAYPDNCEHPWYDEHSKTAYGVYGDYEFIDWNKVAKDYDAVFVDDWIPIWDVPSISVFHADAIESFRVKELNECVREEARFEDLSKEEIDKNIEAFSRGIGFSCSSYYLDESGYHFHFYNGYSMDICGRDIYIIDSEGDLLEYKKIEYFADIIDSLKEISEYEKTIGPKEESVYLEPISSLKTVSAEDLYTQSFISFSSSYTKEVGAGTCAFTPYNYVGDWYEHCMLEGTSPKSAKYVTAFALKKDAKVLEITDEYELSYLFREFPGDSGGSYSRDINWEELAKRYDAVYINTETSHFGPRTMIVLRDEAVEDCNCCRLNKFTEMNPPISLEGYIRSNPNLVTEENKELVETVYKLSRGGAGWDKTCTAFIEHNLEINKLENGDIIISNGEFTSKIRTHHGASWMDVESPNGNYTIKCHDVKSALAILGKDYGADIKETYSSFTQKNMELRNEIHGLLTDDVVATSGDKWSTKIYYENSHGITFINDKAYTFTVDEDGKEQIISKGHVENIEDAEDVMNHVRELEVNKFSNDYDYEL